MGYVQPHHYVCCFYLRYLEILRYRSAGGDYEVKDAHSLRSAYLLFGSFICAVIVWLLFQNGVTLEDAANLGTAFGGFATVAALAFVGRQIGFARNAVLATHFDKTSDRIQQLNEAFLQHPAAKQYIYPTTSPIKPLSKLRRASESPSPDAREPAFDVVDTIAEMHLDFLDTELLRDSKFPDVASELPDFEHWIHGLLVGSAAVGRLLAENYQLYSREMLCRLIDVWEDSESEERNFAAAEGDFPIVGFDSRESFCGRLRLIRSSLGERSTLRSDKWNRVRQSLR